MTCHWKLTEWSIFDLVLMTCHRKFAEKFGEIQWHIIKKGSNGQFGLTLNYSFYLYSMICHRKEVKMLSIMRPYEPAKLFFILINSTSCIWRVCTRFRWVIFSMKSSSTKFQKRCISWFWKMHTFMSHKLWLSPSTCRNISSIEIYFLGNYLRAWGFW